MAFGPWRSNAELIVACRDLGYVCPVCKTWAEDMTPHCFMTHEDDPIKTLAIYVAEAGPPSSDSPTPTNDNGIGEVRPFPTDDPSLAKAPAPIDSAPKTTLSGIPTAAYWPESGGSDVL